MYDFTPEHLAYYNQLEQAYIDIQLNPAHWDQSNWHCGTSHCLAGFCDVREAGVSFDQWPSTVAAWKNPDETYFISPFAQRYPYWEDRADIFDSGNTLEAIRRHLDHIRDHGFWLNAEGDDCHGNNKLDEISVSGIVRGIKKAIYFSWAEGDRSAEFEYAPATDKFLRNYAVSFIEMLEGLWPLPGSEPTPVIERSDPRWDNSECLGGDIWYTTQSHGCGFWEGDDRWIGHWEACDEYCKSHPIDDAYLGDDGLIYILGAEDAI